MSLADGGKRFQAWRMVTVESSPTRQKKYFKLDRIFTVRAPSRVRAREASNFALGSSEIFAICASWTAIENYI